MMVDHDCPINVKVEYLGDAADGGELAAYVPPVRNVVITVTVVTRAGKVAEYRLTAPSAEMEQRVVRNATQVEQALSVLISNITTREAT